MTSERFELIAYLSTLGAIVVLVAIAAVLAGFGKYSEAIGVSAAVTGLIGVIKIPTRRNVTVDNGPERPVPTEQQP